MQTSAKHVEVCSIGLNRVDSEMPRAIIAKRKIRSPIQLLPGLLNQVIVNPTRSGGHSIEKSDKASKQIRF